MNIHDVYREVMFRLSKWNTNASQNLPLPQFVSLVNKAILHWAEERCKVVDVDQTRVDELQQLDTVLIAVPEKKTGYYRVGLPTNYFHRVRASSSTDCGPLYVNFVEEGNVNALLADEFTKPSAAWEETIGTISAGGLNIYVDNFTIGKVSLVYKRLPIMVDIEGYTKKDGAKSSDVHLEFDGVNAQEIIDLAVLFASQDIADQFRLQASANQVQSHN